MAKLTTKERKALPPKDFVFPGGRHYPIQDKAHAIDALSRISEHGSPSEKRKVRAAVRAHYPGIKQSK